MRFLLLPLAVSLGALSACGGGSSEPPRRDEAQEPLRRAEAQARPRAEEAQAPPRPEQARAAGTQRPLAEPASTTDMMARPPEKFAIADQRGGAAREIAAGKLLPLARILDIARRRVPGEIIEVDLYDDQGEPPEYEVEILTDDGRSIEMKIDARTGKILEVEAD